MQKRLSVAPKIIHQLYDIPEVSFTNDRIFEVIGACKHFVFSTRILKDFSLFKSIHKA